MAVMPKYLNNVRDITGQVNNGALVLVTIAGSSTRASVYEDDNITARPNPQQVDAYGNFYFSANPGAYDLYIQVDEGDAIKIPQVTMGSPGGSGAVDSINTRTGSVVLTGADIPVFIQSGTSHAAGAVPDPGSIVGTQKFLCEDGTFKLPPVFVGGSGHQQGAVPDPGGAADGTMALFSDGTWQSPTGFASTYGYTLIQEQQVSGTQGGTFTTGAWQNRTLNVMVTDTTGLVVLSGNQITLPSGFWLFDIECPAYNVNGHQAQLLNITDGIVAAIGTTEYCLTTQTKSRIRCRVTIDVGLVKTFEVQHRCTVTEATNGLGVAAGIGTEVYTSVLIQLEPALPA
jgi:hypothetical protein